MSVLLAVGTVECGCIDGGEHSDLHSDDVRLAQPGLETHEVVTDPPLEAVAGQQIMGCEDGGQSEMGWQDRKALLGLVGIDVDDRDDGVGTGLLGIADQRVVGGVQERDVRQLL